MSQLAKTLSISLIDSLALKISVLTRIIKPSALTSIKSTIYLDEIDKLVSEFDLLKTALDFTEINHIKEVSYILNLLSNRNQNLTVNKRSLLCISDHLGVIKSRLVITT